MVDRIVFSSSLLVTLGLVAMPVAVMAQDVSSHSSSYTASSMGKLLANTGAGRTNMPLVSPEQLPMAALLSHNTLPSGAYAHLPGVALGSSNGVQRNADADNGVEPAAYGNFSGQSIAPYTMGRASATILGSTLTAAAVGVTSYPWRAAGKLYFDIGSNRFVCSASMIAPGLLVTAAHCVYEFGTNSAAGWHSNYAFVPAQNTANATPPYGAWAAEREIIATAYYNGTDSCTQKGVICSNDVAVLTMAPNEDDKLPGNVVGWFGYGWNGYSFTPSFGGASLASFTQLGYPVAFDSGLMMERNDGVGSYWAPGGSVRQTILGSAMTGGSSGGPWLVNFGAVPSVSSAASLGNSANSQIVEGVTSWGYTTVGSNTQGASWFGQNAEFSGASYADSHSVNRGAGNIGALVAAACTVNFARC